MRHVFIRGIAQLSFGSDGYFFTNGLFEIGIQA